MKNLLSINEYVEGVLKKDISVLARAITLVESSKAEHQEISKQIIEKILPHTGESVRLGITGVPGVGKSTFIEIFGQILVQKKHTVAVLAVDPSSTLSKGSILGDKTRMEKLSIDNDVFIRPSPSSGSLGGVARKTRESILLCEAAGFDYIIIETVGVGQSETEVHQLTDFFLLLMLAGAGDELQGIKRGIMEMADGIAITKCDGTNLDKAKIARAEYANAIHLFPPTESGWIPEVKTCSSTENKGIEEVYDMIEKYIRHTQHKNFFQKKRQEQNIFWFESLIQEKIKDYFFSDKKFQQRYTDAKEHITKNETSILNAVNSVFIK
ncbi:MAG TPA: methylmalonyl Co-A mutase-associated GTPase MeaB [Bacteroidia bacterium]|nr:methylmalonyl Co-A mutase-associated GTPase MeaB [Bacteroidia bacterium]